MTTQAILDAVGYSLKADDVVYCYSDKGRSLAKVLATQVEDNTLLVQNYGFHLGETHYLLNEGTKSLIKSNQTICLPNLAPGFSLEKMKTSRQGDDVFANLLRNPVDSAGETLTEGDIVYALGDTGAFIAHFVGVKEEISFEVKYKVYEVKVEGTYTETSYFYPNKVSVLKFHKRIQDEPLPNEWALSLAAFNHGHKYASF